MKLEESTVRYPALISYILDRNTLPTTSSWCSQLRTDEAAAQRGELAEVANEMAQAQRDLGHYPYNRDMGEFLGLPIRANGEPEHGYYMANGVKNNYELGQARNRAASLIASGKTVSFVLATSKKTGKPIRFARFKGSDQIKIQGETVSLNNGKRRVTLKSNWSVQTCLVRLVEHLESGDPYDGSN